MEVLFIDFMKIEPSEDSKESVRVLTDAFSKFSSSFVIPNQMELTVTKILVETQFCFYDITSQIHSEKGHSSQNEIPAQLS